MSRSRKVNERRLPIHPLHFERIEADLRARIYLECGYGERFGVSDERLASLVAGLRRRDQLVAHCDVIVLPKPMPQDLAELRDLMATGKVVPVIDRTYPLHEIAEAMRYLETGHARGKVIITV